MAVVKEFIARNGVHVKINDEAYANASPEEIQRRWREIDRVIYDINMRIQRDALEAAAKAKE